MPTFIAVDHEAAVDSARLSPLSRLNNTQQRKGRNMLSTRVHEQGAAEQRETIELVCFGQRRQEETFKEMMAVQRECFKVLS